jgi:hypothetical protein
MKQRHTMFAVLGVGAVAVLLYLMRKAPLQAAGGVSVAASSPQYPNSQPLKLGDINVAGSPLNITYNIAPPAQPRNQIASDGSCAGDCCNDAGIFVNVNRIAPPVVDAATANLQGFAAKVALNPQRVTFGIAPAHAATDGGALNI